MRVSVRMVCELPAAWYLSERSTVLVGTRDRLVLAGLHQSSTSGTGIGMPQLQATESGWVRPVPEVSPCLYWNGERLREITLRGPGGVTLVAEPLGHDRWMALLAAGGARVRAALLSSSGECLSAFPIGVWVNRWQATNGGYLWVGYSEEGVFSGNMRSATGVACYAPDGRVAFDFNNARKNTDIPNVVFCYGLNVVSDEEVYVHYYYGEYAIAHIRKLAIERVWPKIDVRSVSSLAVSDDLVVLASQAGYGQPGCHLILLDLRTGRLGAIEPLAESGERVPWLLARGRGSLLYLAAATRVWSLDVAGLACRP